MSTVARGQVVYPDTYSLSQEVRLWTLWFSAVTGSGSWCVSILTRGQVMNTEGVSSFNRRGEVDPGASLDVE